MANFFVSSGRKVGLSGARGGHRISCRRVGPAWLAASVERGGSAYVSKAAGLPVIFRWPQKIDCRHRLIPPLFAGFDVSNQFNFRLRLIREKGLDFSIVVYFIII